MLIVCTKDNEIVQAAQNKESAKAWAPLKIVNSGLNQNQATLAIAGFLQGLGNEPLCFSAHGNDEEIGDESSPWGWDSDDIAGLLKANKPNYKGPILIHACSENVSNFSAHLAVALKKKNALIGVWIYGYNKAIDSDAGFPDPNKLDKNVELQGTQVG
ncbi:MAG: hypothetical protein QNJ16_02715 [Rhodobacter sp.]|nr:hypothetical protein [Rhodobacter sp.]